MSDTKIVISGISGVYPKCDNIGELAEKLFAKKDLITDMPDINFSVGKIKSASKFDSAFFGVTNEHAEYMDPMCRILLEKTFEAIVDAGYNPEELRDSNTAVFVASCTSDAEVESTFRTDVKGALICERAQSFLANRISYCFGLHGSSSTVNTACSSSLYALEFACKAIKNDECEKAIVGASNLCLSPGMIDLYKNLGITSDRCRSFDNAAIGFCRAETISAILLQKKEHARRVYAEVIHVKTNNDGYKKQSILFPSHRMQMKLINELYEECGVPKSEIAWVEAHGTGTKIGDYQEMKSLETLCENRDSPLLAGCVKSSLGHTESASGLCSIAKVIIAMETGCIPPNLHFSKPQNGIEVLQNDKIRIITETTSWNGGYVAINNFGIGGANAHLLLKSNTKQAPDTHSLLCSHLPKLVTVSGRTSEAVDVLISYLNSSPMNIMEFIALIHSVFSTDIPNHEYRGYTVIQQDLKSGSISQIQKVKNKKRPIWFVYPGMGSQWAGMGKRLLQFHTFEQSILECHRILQKNGVDLLEIITDEKSETLQNILHCFVGITAMMIALTDLLKSIGIEAEGIVGHSFGEIVCGYADNCLTKEEALLVAYFRGIVSLEKCTIKGTMAVVGLNGRTVQKRCYKLVEVVCYNGLNSCTVAGPTNDVERLVQELRSQNIFAAVVYSSNIAYHSSYIQELGLPYCAYLKEVIVNPKQRSKKWLSSSIRDSSDCESNVGNYCSAEYFVNNLVNPVHFENALKGIPNNAITIEVAPHSILKSALNCTLNSTNSSISLMDKNVPDVVHNLLKSLGCLYNEGIQIDLSKLYPAVSFPVSRGTPMISPLIRWDHKKDWYVPFANLDPTEGISGASNGHKVQFTYEKKECRYLQDHIVDGKNIFPEAALLKMVWDLAVESVPSCSSIIFKDVHFLKRIEIPATGSFDFEIMLTRISGHFEVILKSTVVAHGYIEIIDEKQDNIPVVEWDNTTGKKTFKLKAVDLYKELRIKGYHYGAKFQKIIECNLEGTTGVLKWDKNWVMNINSVFQFLYLRVSDLDHLCTVSYIGWLRVRVFGKASKPSKEVSLVISLQDNPLRVCCEYVNMTDIKFRRIKRQVYPEPVVQSIEFTPYFNYTKSISVSEMVEIILTIILSNNSTLELNIHEFCTNTDDGTHTLSHEIYKYFRIRSFYKTNITVHTSEVGSSELTSDGINFTDKPFNFSVERNVHLIILSNSSSNLDVLIKSFASLSESGFFLTRENKEEAVFNKVKGFEICAVYLLKKEKIVLWHKVLNYKSERYVNVTESLDWIEVLQEILKKPTDTSNNKVILYSNHKYSGLVGFFNCIRKESYNCQIRCLLVLDSNVPSFDSDKKFYSDQMKIDLAVNVYKNGRWGCYVPYKISSEQKVDSVKVALSQEEVDDGIEVTWVEDHNSYWNNNDNEDLINVYKAMYLNDILNESCISIKESKNVSFTFSGKDYFGSNVMGISFNSRISNTVPKSNCLHWAVPQNWNLDHAVISVFPYLGALVTFVDQTSKEGDVVLIQNKCPLGQALTVIALLYGYTVFTVENDIRCIRHITRNFMKQSESFTIIDNFFEKVNNGNYGKVAMFIVTDIGFLTYELVNSISCKKVIYVENEDGGTLTINETMLAKKIHTEKINLHHLSYSQLQKVKNIFDEIIENNYHNLMALSVVDFTEINIPPNGKIKLIPGHRKFFYNIIKTKENDHEISAVIEVEPRFKCFPDKCYIICGGLGGMGFELANWLVEHGASKLILVSRTGSCDSYRLRKILNWRQSGVVVVISVDNISSSDGVRNLLAAANKLGSVAGIFNTTLVLRDNIFENQTLKNFQEVAAPKAIATILLDKESRTSCPELQHFVVFSSIVCGYGNAGQSNYGYANSVMERVCEARREDGLPGLAIEWAGVDDVGYTENSAIKPIANGTLLQPIRSCLRLMNQFLSQSRSIVTSFMVTDSYMRSDKKLMSDDVLTTINKIIDQSDIELEDETTLKDIGLDSITVVETKNIIEQEFNLPMDTKEVLNLRVRDLRKIMKNRASPLISKSTKKLAILEEFYTHLFKAMLETSNPLNMIRLVRLSSFLHNGATNEVSTSREKTIFFLPSVEGFPSVMQPLANNMDIQVLCAQYSLTKISVKQMTSELFPEIEKRLITGERFHLLGYSYGGLLAMEIAHALEKRGRIGFVYMIDSSPKIVKHIAQVLFRDEEYRTNNLAFVRALNCGIDLRKFSNCIRGAQKWQDLKKITLDVIPHSVAYNKDHLEFILDTIQIRNDDLNLYEGIPKKSLVSKVIFFKPKDPLFNIPSSHDLAEYCCSPVQVYEIDGNHFTMLKSEKLAYYLRTLYKLEET